MLQVIEQMAKSCDKTSVQLRTNESINNFNLRVSVKELPSLDTVFPILVQLSQLKSRNLSVYAIGPQPADGAVAGVTGLELKWTPGISVKTHRVYFGTDKDNLSLLGEVSTPNYANVPVLEPEKTYYWRIDEVRADASVTV